MSEKEILQTILNRIDEAVKIQHSEFLSLDETCKYMGVTKVHMYRLMRDRLITYSKPTGKVAYFKKSDIEEYLSRNTIPSFASLEAMAADYAINKVV